MNAKPTRILDADYCEVSAGEGWDRVTPNTLRGVLQFWTGRWCRLFPGAIQALRTRRVVGRPIDEARLVAGTEDEIAFEEGSPVHANHDGKPCPFNAEWCRVTERYDLEEPYLR